MRHIRSMENWVILGYPLGANGKIGDHIQIFIRRNGQKSYELLRGSV
jgi:hypothetical protein